MENNYKGWFEITEYIGVNKKIVRDGGGTGVEGNIGKYQGASNYPTLEKQGNIGKYGWSVLGGRYTLKVVGEW